MISSNNYICNSCGAPVDLKLEKCPYCDVPYYPRRARHDPTSIDYNMYLDLEIMTPNECRELYKEAVAAYRLAAYNSNGELMIF